MGSLGTWACWLTGLGRQVRLPQYYDAGMLRWLVVTDSGSNFDGRLVLTAAPAYSRHKQAADSIVMRFNE